MANPTIEVCCGSAEDVFQAKSGGADRVELNSGLFFGGLTPSVGTVSEAAEAGLPIMAMVRPREGGFCYSDREFSVMLKDAAALLKAGAAGIVFGMLHEDGSINCTQLRQMMEVIGPHEAVFHRAIDIVGERWQSVLDILCEHHVHRVLTSGQKVTAMDGKETIRQMREYAGDRIEILPGGSVRAHNIRALLDYTGCNQAHTSGSRLCSDPTSFLTPEIAFTAKLLPAEDVYKIVDPATIRGVVDAASGT